MCWCQKWFLKNKKTSLACILTRNIIWKAPTTTLPNILFCASAEVFSFGLVIPLGNLALEETPFCLVRWDKLIRLARGSENVRSDLAPYFLLKGKQKLLKNLIKNLDAWRAWTWTWILNKHKHSFKYKIDTHTIVFVKLYKIHHMFIDLGSWSD
jgi:hypothetical protein